MKTNTIKTVVLLFVISISLSVTTVYAKQSTNSANKSQFPHLNLLDLLNQKKEDWLESRCQRITKRIDKKIENYDSVKKRYHGINQGIQNRLDNLIKRAQKAGYDVTKLQEDKAQLDDKVKNLEPLYDNYIQKLKDTKSYACGQSEGQFAKSLQEARAELKKLRDAIFDIRTFYQTTIRPDIRALKDQKPTTNEEEK